MAIPILMPMAHTQEVDGVRGLELGEYEKSGDDFTNLAEPGADPCTLDIGEILD